MKRVLALEWDIAEIRGVVGRSRGRDGLVIEQAFAVPLSREGQGSDEAEIGPQLAAALRAIGVRRLDAVVGVGRASIEMRQLQLPAAPEEELPDMVRFQAMRQFTAIGEDWPVDFVPLERSETSIQVLAAAISPQWVRQAVEACRAAELTPRRLVLRPFAAASLLRRLPTAADSQVRLVVDVLSADADLFVLAAGQVVFVRTVRLPHGESATTSRATALVGELRRTIAAAQSQLGGKRIESIVLFGDATRHADLLGLIDKQLNLPTECIDPFAIVATSASSAGVAAELAGRFAPLLGMLADELGQVPPAMDFLHPRKRPERKTRRERVLLAITALLAVVCLLGIVVKWKLTGYDRRIAQLKGELKTAEKSVKEVAKRTDELKRLEQFAESSLPWLDELRRLSLRFLPAKEAVVTKFSASYQSGGQGQLTVEGLVSDPRRVIDMENALRDDAHRVFGRNTVQQTHGESLNWSYHETIQVDVAKLKSTPAPTAPALERPSPTKPSPPKTPADKDDSFTSQTAREAVYVAP